MSVRSPGEAGDLHYIPGLRARGRGHDFHLDMRVNERARDVPTLSGVLAHMTMASLKMPLILLGFRLQQRMAILSCISASGMNLTWSEARVSGDKVIPTDQPRDDGPGPVLPHVHLLHVQRVGVRVAAGRPGQGRLQ